MLLDLNRILDVDNKRQKLPIIASGDAEHQDILNQFAYYRNKSWRAGVE
jgi:hypothetical protein